MTPALPEQVHQQILRLMATVDAAFEAGRFTLGEELDACLEQQLDDLDHRWSEEQEGGGDVIDDDNHVGIEDQFIAAWSQVLAGIGSFAHPAGDAELAAHLRAVLRDEATKGPYAPQPFLGLATDGELLALAADLWNERQALILGTR